MDLEQKRSFAVRLAKLREERNLTQQELADETKILRVTIAKYESQKRIPSFEDLTMLAIYFNTTTDYFLGLTDVVRVETPEDEKTKITCDYTGLSEDAVKKLVDEKAEGFNDRIDILSWLISQEYTLELCNLLYDIDDSSQYCEDVIEEYQKRFEEMEKQVKSNNPVSISDLSAIDGLNDTINEYFDRVDVARYRLIKFTESLANFYDNRKQNAITHEISPELHYTVNQLRRECASLQLWHYLRENRLLKKEDPDNGEHNPKEE